jgi:putative ABC transport system permease protein
MDSTGIVNLGFLNLALAYGLVLLAIALARLQHIGQEGEMLWSSLRMVLQLLAVGYLLHGVFTVNSPVPVLLILLVMVGFSVQVMGHGSGARCPAFTGLWGVPSSSAAAG